MPTARWYAAAVATPTEHRIAVVGGRNTAWDELASVDVCHVASSDQTLEWSRLGHNMPTPRFGCAAVLVQLPGKQQQTLLVLGGYHGSDCLASCCTYEWSESFLQGQWNDTDIPDMLVPCRFVKAAVHQQYVYCAGESVEEEGTAVLQCLDMNSKRWIWSKHLQSNNVGDIQALVVQDSHLFCLATTGSEGSSSMNNLRVHRCSIASLGSSTLAVHAAPVATAVSVEAGPKQDRKSNNDDEEEGIVLESVKSVVLQGGASKYSGQMKKTGATWIPHGEGLEVWVDEKKQFHPLGEKKNSYYRGRFRSGYRDGLGEMYLVAEDQRYIGSFLQGSWHGIGTQVIASRFFEYCGNFVAGERSGQGRCTYRAQDSKGMWTKKCYSGQWDKGLACGKGIITDAETGRVLESRTFHHEPILK